MSIAAEKQSLRERAKARREAAAQGHAEDAARAVAERLLAEVELPKTPGTVSGYAAIGSEIDVFPTMTALMARGWKLCLPVTGARAQPMEFRAWTLGESLMHDRLGIPTPHAHQPVMIPQVVLVPLIAFDRRGFRLGHGHGFYDATLKSLPGALTIATAYAAQEVPEVPTEDNDVAVQWIVTEREVIRCSGGRL